MSRSLGQVQGHMSKNAFPGGLPLIEKQSCVLAACHTWCLTNVAIALKTEDHCIKSVSNLLTSGNMLCLKKTLLLTSEIYLRHSVLASPWYMPCTVAHCCIMCTTGAVVCGWRRWRSCELLNMHHSSSLLLHQQLHLSPRYASRCLFGFVDVLSIVIHKVFVAVWVMCCW